MGKPRGGSRIRLFGQPSRNRGATGAGSSVKAKASGSPDRVSLERIAHILCEIVERLRPVTRMDLVLFSPNHLLLGSEP